MTYDVHGEPIGEYIANTIVSRNVDMLPSVYASSRYGINGTGKANFRKCLSLLVATDFHKSEPQAKNWIEYLNAIPSFDAGINLGDMAAGSYTDTDGTWYSAIVGTAEKPVYTVIGNHDIHHAPSHSAVVDKWIVQNRDAIGIPDLNTGYYAINFENYPVTLIVLDNYDWPDNTEITTMTECYSQAQLDWLISTLANVASGRHVIIARHSNIALADIDAGPWTFGETPPSPNSDAYNNAPIIEDIVNAWQTGGTLNETYTPNNNMFPTLSVSANFHSRGSGVFIGFLNGHVHRDVISHGHKYQGQKIYTFTTAANDLWQNGSGDLPRVAGTKTEDAITCMSIDTSDRKVRLVRIGSNVSYTMVKREIGEFSY